MDTTNLDDLELSGDQRQPAMLDHCRLKINNAHIVNNYYGTTGPACHQEDANFWQQYGPATFHESTISYDEELCHFIHPQVDSSQEWAVHDEIKRLVRRQGIQEICQYLLLMEQEKRILLPQLPSVAYPELVRMGMPTGEGFSIKTFQRYYRK